MDTPSTSHLTFENVYEPAEDTFLLMDAIEQDLEWLSKKNLSLCVEVGCGSGVITSAVGRALKLFCLAIDINPAACRATKSTAQRHGVGESVETISADLIGPMKYRLKNQVDLLIFNPPYVPTKSEEITDSNISRSWAGGVLGRQVTDRLLVDVAYLLSQEGVFYLLLLQENKPEEVKGLLEDQGLKCDVILSRRAGRESLVVLRAFKWQRP